MIIIIVIFIFGNFCVASFSVFTAWGVGDLLTVTSYAGFARTVAKIKVRLLAEHHYLCFLTKTYYLHVSNAKSSASSPDNQIV